MPKSEEAAPVLCISHRGHLRMVDLFERTDLWSHVRTLEAHVGSLVAHLIAIVGCAEHS
jgi:hypothetical protein